MAVSGAKVEKYAGRLIIAHLAAEAITAGNVVYVSADGTVSQSDGNELVLTGVALQTASAINDLIDVDFGYGVVYDLAASGAINAGQAVAAAAAGAVAAIAADGDPRLLKGYALTAAASNVVTVVIK
jgi:hypothetical protein